MQIEHSNSNMEAADWNFKWALILIRHIWKLKLFYRRPNFDLWAVLGNVYCLAIFLKLKKVKIFLVVLLIAFIIYFSFTDHVSWWLICMCNVIKCFKISFKCNGICLNRVNSSSNVAEACCPKVSEKYARKIVDDTKF